MIKAQDIRLRELLSHCEEGFADTASGILQEGTWEYHGILLHSRRDPRREASRQLQEAGKARHLILLGAGLGYLLTAIRDAGISGSVIVIEPDAHLLYLQLQLLQKLGTNTEDIWYMPMFSPQDSLESLLPWLQGKNIHHIAILPHRSSFQARPDIYMPLHSRLKAFLSKREVNQATILKFQDLWNRNITMNSALMSCSARLDDVSHQLTGKLVLIAGAGPSLLQDAADLIRFRSKFLLLAADTAVIPLLKAGIVPDVAAAADPQWINHFYGLHERAAEITWIFDPVVVPALPHWLFRTGAKIAFWDNEFPMDSYLRGGRSRGQVAHGGSVSTNLLDIAIKSGAHKIILIGQDFAFSESHAHVRGAALESAVYYRSNRLGGMELHNFRQLWALPRIPVETNYGDKAVTNAKLQIFLEWFTERISGSQVPVINTGRGAVIRGTELSGIPKVITEKLPDCAGVRIHSRDNVRAGISLSALRDQFVRIRELSLTNKKLSQGNRSSDHRKQLDENDLRIAELTPAKEIISLGIQSVILPMTEAGQEVSAAEFYCAMAGSAEKLIGLVDKSIRMSEQISHSQS